MPECRICLESDEIGNLISPCNCRGSSQWVHTECLNEWRNTNINTRSNRQCEICLFNYIISSAERKETFIISIHDYKYPFFEFFLSMFITFVFGNLIMFIDSQNDFETIKFFKLDHLNDKFNFDDDTWFIWTYYQGLSSFILNIIFFSLFNIMSCFKVIRKKKYFYKMIIMNLSCFLYTFNFIFFIYISKMARSTSLLGFWSPLFVSFHCSSNVKFIKKHNKILEKINDALPMDVISSFQLNPISVTVPLTITDYIHTEVVDEQDISESVD